jgi:hypothetical protein
MRGNDMTDFATFAETHLAAEWEGADDQTAWMDEYEYDMNDLYADESTWEDHSLNDFDPWAESAFDFDFEPPF